MNETQTEYTPDMTDKYKLFINGIEILCYSLTFISRSKNYVSGWEIQAHKPLVKQHLGNVEFVTLTIEGVTVVNNWGIVGRVGDGSSINGATFPEVLKLSEIVSYSLRWNE